LLPFDAASKEHVTLTDVEPREADYGWLPDEVPLDNTAGLAKVRATIQNGPYTDTWESLAGYTVPRWFRDAKFGIFIHWGVYSVPAFHSEWYPRNMYRQGTAEFEHHVAAHGPQARFGYKDFVPRFTMERFDPKDMVALFRRAGAQFVVPVAEHHDGFAMYDEPRTRWKAPLVGPVRDVYGELTSELRRQWLIPGASSHRAEHWFFFNGGAKFDSDVTDPDYADLYGPAQHEETTPNEAFLEDWLLRTVEIIDRYQPQVLWFDWWIESPGFEPYLRQLAAYYYNRAAEWGREVIIQYKHDAFPPGTAVYDVERGGSSGIRPEPWQNDTSVSRNSWGWIDGHDYKSTKDIVGEIIDVVAKNGCLLLNIGPKPDGSIAEPERALLEGIGDWLNVNGEAVYGTSPWVLPGEGPTAVPEGSFTDGSPLTYTSADFRFTQHVYPDQTYLYAVSTTWPEDGTARIKTLAAGSTVPVHGIADVTLLGHGESLVSRREADALVVELPDVRPSEFGLALRITLTHPEPARRDRWLHN
jgi:alpha-L-fucosidase